VQEGRIRCIGQRSGWSRVAGSLGRACEEKVNDSDLQHSNLGRDTRESAAVSHGNLLQRARGYARETGRQTPFARCTPDGACGRGRPAAEQEHTYHAPNHTSHLAIPIRFPVAGPHQAHTSHPCSIATPRGRGAHGWLRSPGPRQPTPLAPLGTCLCPCFCPCAST
jgi:hypothetical protein